MDALDNLQGIVSLLLASIEIVLLINVMIFAEKNRINKYLFVLIFLLFSYQLFEFLICYVQLTDSIWIYFAFVLLSLLPPLGLLSVLAITGRNKKLNLLLFLPPLFFAVYYPFVLESLEVKLCTIFVAEYDYPLSILYGIFYYYPILFTLVLLVLELRKDINSKRKRNIGFLIAGYTFTFISPLIIIIFYPPIIKVIESFLCKFALFLAVAASFFTLFNKTE
jgi:hypothetical protein